jgi:virginiamycin B lyase
MRLWICLLSGLVACATLTVGGPANSTKASAKEKTAATPAAPKSGIKTPGVQIPFASLKSEAEIPVEGAAWMTTGAAILVPSNPQDTLVRIDPKGNKTMDPVTGLDKPCAGAVVAFGSIWTPNCGSKSLVRVDAKTAKITATLAVGASDVPIGIAATPDSVWMLTDTKATLSRIDPDQNVVAGEIRLRSDCDSVTFAEKSLWVTCAGENRVLRIDPVTNLVEKRIDVSASPRALASGGGSIWVLCDKDGKIDRIDPKTNKVIKTIDLMTPGAGGSLAFGEGFLWVTQTGFPLTRIDPKSDEEKVVQQFWGEGGGFISVSNGAVWLSNTAPGTVTRFDPKRIYATLAE